MTELKIQAIEMLKDVPEDKMVYVVDLLKWLNGLFHDNGVGYTASNGASPDSLAAWEAFKKYKGMIHCDIDERAELAEARDEKYADFN